jgi:hypothetical protein
MSRAKSLAVAATVIISSKGRDKSLNKKNVGQKVDCKTRRREAKRKIIEINEE